MRHSDTQWSEVGVDTREPRRYLSGMCGALLPFDSHTLYLCFSIRREELGGRELLADTRAECGGVSRQGKSRQEELQSVDIG